MLIKKKLMFAVLSISCCVSFSAMANHRECMVATEILELSIGDISYAGSGIHYEDGDNGIFVAIKNERGAIGNIPVSMNSNLNDPSGPGILSLLKTAAITGAKIKFVDSSGSCGSFDTAILIPR